jgi:hypothetical protein
LDVFFLHTFICDCACLNRGNAGLKSLIQDGRNNYSDEFS